MPDLIVFSDKLRDPDTWNRFQPVNQSGVFDTSVGAILIDDLNRHPFGDQLGEILRNAWRLGLVFGAKGKA